ncbi:MAG: glycosyl transferase group 1 [Bacteroidetes bacterium]|nr:glycosyl transferase group 1 [Bacteroidota bacterium]
MAGASWGGSEELWLKAAAHALEKGHSVVVSVYDWGVLHPKLKQLQEKGAAISLRKKVYYGGSASQRIKGFFVKKVFAANEILALKKYRPDAVIISQGTIYECMFPEFTALAESTGAKLSVITQANSEYETLPPACFETGRKLFHSAFQLYFVSRRNMEVAERQLAMKFENANAVSNPANLHSYEVCKWNEASTLNFAFVGRLNSTVKGLGVLLEVLGQPQWKERSWQLNLYGKGEDEGYLKELLKLYQLESNVNFKGFVSDIKQVWELNHVLLMASTLEGTPLSLIEAMLCGRTAVVSDVGGNAELINEGINGFVAEAPSVNSFGKAMERMWIKKAELQSLGLAANRFINEQVQFDAHEQIIKALEQNK